MSYGGEKLMTRILNMGSINIDYVYAVPHFVQAGETLASTARQIFPGGKGLNQSVALARAGTSVFHAGMIGNEGLSLVNTLQEAGVDTSMVKQCDVPTGHTVIQVNPEGENCILLFPGANTELDEAFADKALSSFAENDILVLQNEVSSVAYAMKKAKAKGMRIALNPSPFGPEIEKYPLDLADWFLLNEIEGQALTGKSEPVDILKTMSERYPAAITVLTLGEDGVLCYAGGNVLSHKSYKVPIVDTTAAGDTFTGYFIGAIAKGESIKEALRLASVGASISVSRQGASVSIPCWKEVLEARS
jgi:ribokinase